MALVCTVHGKLLAVLGHAMALPLLKRAIVGRADCEADIKGFSNALYKGFPTAAEAESYLKIHETSNVPAASRPPKSGALLHHLRFTPLAPTHLSILAASPKKPAYYAVAQGKNGAQIHSDW